MAYVGSANVVVSNGAGTYLHTLKSALVLAGWTVVSSGTGTAGTTGAGDLLPTAASFGVANAWARLQEPTVLGGIGPREYILQNGPANNGTTAIIKYSRATGFGTGGTATLAPTTGGGDGQVLIGAYGSTDASPTAALLANATGFVAAVASDTASPGIYGGYAWYLLGWAAGGANLISVLTESVTVGSTSSLDQDPMWRYGTGAGTPVNPTPGFIGGAWYSNQIIGISYWQAYGIPAAPPTYIRGAQAGFATVNQPGSTTYVRTTSNFISVSPYDGREPMYPLIVGQVGVPTGYAIPASIPKGYTTGIATYATTHNLLDTFNLATADPKIAIANNTSPQVNLAMPWLTNIVPAI